MASSVDRARSFVTLLLLCALSWDRDASAQPVPSERPGQTISAGYFVVDFAHSGDSDPAVRYDYTDPAFGITYANPFLTFGVLYGPPAGADTSRARLLDVSLAALTSVDLFRRREPARQGIYFPVGISGGYRRVRRDLSGGRRDQFDVTTLMLMGGVGARARVSKKAGLELRGTPGAGIATRSFGDATGLAYVFDADARVTFAPVAGRYGLSLGYGYRFQGWNMRLSRLLRSSLPGDIYDYRNQQHGFRVGVAF